MLQVFFRPERFLQFRTLLHKTAKIKHPDSPDTNLLEMLQLVQLNVDSERARGEFDPQLQTNGSQSPLLRALDRFRLIATGQQRLLVICTSVISVEKTMEARA